MVNVASTSLSTGDIAFQVVTTSTSKDAKYGCGVFSLKSELWLCCVIFVLPVVFCWQITLIFMTMVRNMIYYLWSIYCTGLGSSFLHSFLTLGILVLKMAFVSSWLLNHSLKMYIFRTGWSRCSWMCLRNWVTRFKGMCFIVNLSYFLYSCA